MIIEQQDVHHRIMGEQHSSEPWGEPYRSGLGTVRATFNNILKSRKPYVSIQLLTIHLHSTSNQFHASHDHRENIFLDGLMIIEQQDMQRRTTSEPYNSRTYVANLLRVWVRHI